MTRSEVAQKLRKSQWVATVDFDLSPVNHEWLRYWEPLEDHTGFYRHPDLELADVLVVESPDELIDYFVVVEMDVVKDYLLIEYYDNFEEAVLRRHELS